jgi:hypothetical protein
MTDDLAPLLVRIRDLAEHRDDASEPLLARMEHTLTDGYAHALALEGESIRIEQEIGRLVARVEDSEESGRLRALTDRLARTERQLHRLRGLLDVLRVRQERVRSSVRQGV